MTRWTAPLALLVACLGPGALHAQDAAMSRAFELERQGNYAGAAAAYRAVLAARPASASALLGLERVLLPLDRPTDILPQVRAALAAGPANAPVYGVALRAWAAADEPDSMRAIAERWAAAVPGDEAPFREWGAAALARRDRAGAVAAYRRGREELRRPDALAAELAQVAVADGDYRGALGEWLAAVRSLPGYRGIAVGTLAQAPDSLRPDLLAQLGHERDFTAVQLEADLQTRWGDPLGALKRLESALPTAGPAAIEALHGFVAQLRTASGRDARAAQGRALELIAGRSPPSEQARFRLDAARAYTQAGDRDAARRMLVGIADDRSAPATVAAGASSTLVQVLIGEGKLDEAARRLAEHQAGMAGDEYAGLRRRLVLGYISAGNLARGVAARRRQYRGWARAGRPDQALPGRSRRRGAAVQGGRPVRRRPRRGHRAHGTAGAAAADRAGPSPNSAPPCCGWPGGNGRGDRRTGPGGRHAPAAHGGAEIRLLAGRLAAAAAEAGRCRAAAPGRGRAGRAGTAPAAELALADLLLQQKRPADAVAQLEHLILTYPGSALVPQARRRLDEARGAVPRT